jgi:hypothetical protein
VADAFRDHDRTTVPAWVSNTVRTLRVVYVLVSAGIRGYADGAWGMPRFGPHQALLQTRLARTLAVFDRQVGTPDA